MATFHKHVFICTNERDSADERGCCSSRGSAELVECFKRKLHERGLKRVVRANKAGCLDQCAHGPVVVVYPDAVWYGRVSAEDVDRIIDEHILGAAPVESLRIAPDQLTGKPLPPRPPAHPDRD